MRGFQSKISEQEEAEGGPRHIWPSHQQAPRDDVSNAVSVGGLDIGAVQPVTKRLLAVPPTNRKAVVHLGQMLR